MRRGEANFKVAANHLAGDWSQIMQSAYSFITAAWAGVESGSVNASNALENDDLLGPAGLGMEPANHNAVRPAGVRLRRARDVQERRSTYEENRGHH
jgi:hypothetical protein